MSRSVSAPSSVTNTSPCWNGLIVPGSTLMYGSNFWIVTDRPRATSRCPSEAAAMPFPSAETTPPVTKTKRVSGRLAGIQALGRRVYSAGRREPARSGGGEELLRVPAGGPVRGLRSEHPNQLLDHAVALELLDGGERGRVGGGLHDPEVAAGEGRDRRQVGDAQHLTGLGERAQPLAHRAGGLPADAGVDLVEHERPRLAGPGDRHEREHHARQLASGRHFADRRDRDAGVRREHELDPLRAARPDLLASVEAHLERRALQRETVELLADARGQGR